MDVFTFQNLAQILVALLVVTLPGTALYLLAQRVLRREATDSVWAAPLFGIGLSVAFWPLLLLYVTLLGQRFTPLALWVLLSLSVLVIMWLGLPWLRRSGMGRESLVTGACLLGLTGFALALRMGDVQGLWVPLFGDSLHHTLITAIIADTGRVPSGYQPYVPVDTYTYHFGFHTLAAVLAQLTGAAPQIAVLIMGQVLNAMSLPVAYLLSRQLFDSRLAGLAAALLTGFVSVMPGYYANWGRYTQLAGLILLPVGMALLARVAGREAGRHDITLSAFCVAGLAVVHYRILIFYALLALALFVWHVFMSWSEWRALFIAWRRVTLTTVGGLLVAAPWLWNVVSNYIPGLVARLRTVSPDYILSYNSLENFRAFVGASLVAAALVGLLIALTMVVTRRKPPDKSSQSAESLMAAPANALVMATWALLMVVSIWVPPGAIGSYTASISLYMPLAALGGYGIAYLAQKVSARLNAPEWALAAAVLVAAPICAFVQTHGAWRLVDAGHFAYVHDADLAAFDWIRANTPPNAKFLISSEFSYAGKAVTASDAGMWLPLLAGRNVSVPALASWTERPIVPDFFTNTRTLAAYTQPLTDPVVQQLVAQRSMEQPQQVSSPLLLSAMREMGVTHVYSGSPGGASKNRLDIAGMRADSCHYKLLTPPKEGAYIFQVLYDGSGCRK